MDCNDAKMNFISTAWSHRPFGGDTWPLLVHLSRRTSPCLSKLKKKISNVSHFQWGNLMQVWLTLLSGSRASVQPHPSSLPLLPPTLSSWCGLCALSDITTDTRQRELVARYYSLTFLRLFQLYLSSSSLARHMPCKVCGAQSANRPSGDRFVNVDWEVIVPSL